MTTATTMLDPLAPCHPGRWSTGRVTVCHSDRHSVRVRVLAAWPPDARTDHFRVHRTRDALVVLHRMRPDELDDDLAGIVAGELGGMLDGPEDFRRVFTGVVRSTVDDPVTAWVVFYGNTLAALADDDGPDGSGSIAGFAPVHRRAAELVTGRRVLDLGSCFGFLALRLAGRGQWVIGSDLCPGTAGLLATVARHLGRPLSTLVCDAAAVPLADGAVDTVTAVHLLEHLTPGHGAAVLTEAMRISRRRVVVAVPFEDEPEPLYGHLRRFDVAALHRLGRGTGLPYRVDVHHGGWLVIDHPSTPDKGPERGPGSCAHPNKGPKRGCS